MLSCKEATRILSEGLDRKLPLHRRLAVRLHVILCALCRTYSRQLRALDGLIRSRFQDGPPPRSEPARPALSPEARERLKAVLKGSDSKEDEP
jgi:hypothetical protein